jgi:uncharacterized membrane protein required for colicin V production
MKNFAEFLYQFNWIDIVVVILTLRILYISFKNGLKVEFFKFCGIVCALYISLQYYSALSVFLNNRVFNRHTHSRLFDTLSFGLLIVVGYGVIVLARILIGRVVHSEIDARLDKWGGFVLGVFRALFTVSIALCLLIVSSSEYFKKSIKGSFSGTYMAAVAPNVYLHMNGFVSKLQKNENQNSSVKDLTTIR